MESESDVIFVSDNPPEPKNNELQGNNISGSKPKRRPVVAPLKSCFISIVDGKKVDFDLKTLESIISNELHIDIKKLDPTLLQILPYMLVSYIKSWPGWSKHEDYRNGSLKLDEWFGKFHHYASFKLKYIIQKEFQKAVNELRNEKSSYETSSETQCHSINFTGGKSLSAFSVNFGGPPVLLNTLIFSSKGDDIIARTHSIKDWSEDFSLQHLINWPYLEVDFYSPFISFTRKMIPNFLRYLAYADDVMHCRKQDFLENVKVNSDVNRTAYSVSFLRQYLREYIQYLKSQTVDNNKIIELDCLLSEFFRDVVEVGSVQDDKFLDSTTVSFNIGGSRYARNKKTANCQNEPNAPTVGFCEVITPKCSIQLKKLHTDRIVGVDSPNPTIPASFFTDYQNSMAATPSFQPFIDNLPCLMYSCNFCKKQYGGTFALNAVLKHYREEHRMEHEIMCFECKKQYKVTDLSKTRWYHDCELNPKTKNPSSVRIFDD